MVRVVSHVNLPDLDRGGTARVVWSSRWAGLADAGRVTVLEDATDEADGVPDGTVDDVLDWVAADPDRAVEALTVERQGKGRLSLIGALEVIADE